MSKLKSLIKKTKSLTHEAIRNFDANSTLTVHGINPQNPNSIMINNPFYENGLFCVELATASNVENFIDEKSIENLSSKFKYKKDGFLYWVLLKKGSWQKNYIFTYSQEIAQYTADYYGTKMLDAFEQLNVLYDLQLDNQFTANLKKKEILRNLDLTQNITYEFVNYKFNLLIKDAVYENLKTTNVYQATHYKNPTKKTDLTKLFSLDFTGAVYTYISFNKGTASGILQKNISDANQSMTGEKPKLSRLKESIDDDIIKVACMNTAVIIKKETDSLSVNSDIAESLNITLKKEKEGRTSRKNIIKYSPLVKRNNLWTRIVDTEYLYNYICSVHKKTLFVRDDRPQSNPQIYGYDNKKAFTNYNIKWTTMELGLQKAHFFIGGKTGSTKTTFANTMISQMIGYNWETDKIENPQAVKIRQFDIKKSLKAYAQYVKTHNKDSVNILETDLNEFSYNLINISQDTQGRLDQNDLAFCKATASFILMAKDPKNKDATLSFDEDTLFGKLIEEAYSNQEQEKTAISIIERYQKDLAQELYDLGYSKYDYLQDIKEKEYDFLKKPTLDAIVSKLNYIEQNGQVQADTVHLTTVLSLRKKIKTIAELGQYKTPDQDEVPGYFNRYERMNLDYEKQWLLFDMDKIKELPEYAPIQWILLNKIAFEDKKGQIARREAGLPESQIIYFIEEAHNMFNNPLFRSTDDSAGILDKPAKEWRSYNMILAPISQEPNHIPDEVFNAIETSFFLFPNKSDDMSIIKNQLKEIEKKLGLQDNKKVMDLLESTPQFHACAINSEGAFIIGLPTTEKMRTVFDGKWNPDS